VIMRRPVQIGLAPNVVLDSAFLPGAADAAGTGETDAAPAAGPALAGEQATPLLATLGVLGGAALCLAAILVAYVLRRPVRLPARIARPCYHARRPRTAARSGPLEWRQGPRDAKVASASPSHRPACVPGRIERAVPLAARADSRRAAQPCLAQPEPF